MKGQINMKKLTKILSLMLALTMLLNFPVAVSAAELEDSPIDESRTGSLTIYKYDLTNAEKDGVWDSSYVSTGVFDQTGVNLSGQRRNRLRLRYQGRGVQLCPGCGCCPVLRVRK